MVPKDQLSIPFKPLARSLSVINPNNDLQGIEIVHVSEDGLKARCKIGAATTGEQFRFWVIEQWKSGQQNLWTLPLDVIMKHITYGGSNAPICHGAGLKNPTLSDLVTEIEFVDPNGILQTVNDREQLQALAGCFGMMGIVTALTFELDKLTYANMKPIALPAEKAIPPPLGVDVPHALKMDMSDEERKQCFDEFVERCENDYYAEWFWFVFQKDVWVNTWKNDATLNVEDYPSKDQKLLQWTEEAIGNLLISLDQWITKQGWHIHLPYLQARFTACFAMISLPKNGNTPPIKTPLIDALHFRYGVQNMRVHDSEWEIPIPAGNDGKADWTIVQKAWWAVITAFYTRYHNNSSDIPMRLCMEMRITAGSDIIMAPQHGNTLGTCSIEILTPQNVDEVEWLGFMQEISDYWLKYSGPEGPLNTRPHWAKQWKGLQVRGKDIDEYLVEDAYAEQIPKFGQQLQAVAKVCNFTIQDAFKRFSNPLLRKLFKGIPGYQAK